MADLLATFVHPNDTRPNGPLTVTLRRPGLRERRKMAKELRLKQIPRHVEGAPPGRDVIWYTPGAETDGLGLGEWLQAAYVSAINLPDGEDGELLKGGDIEVLFDERWFVKGTFKEDSYINGVFVKDAPFTNPAFPKWLNIQYNAYPWPDPLADPSVPNSVPS